MLRHAYEPTTLSRQYQAAPIVCNRKPSDLFPKGRQKYSFKPGRATKSFIGIVNDCLNK